MNVGYVPEEQRDSRWYLWNRRFMCRVPNIHTMSVDYIRHFGMPTCGDPMRDEEMANELVIRMLTVVEMVDYFSRGVTVAVTNYDDTRLIYEYISNHLNAWKQELENSVNVRDAPIDDLLLMDRFATAVYKHARTLITQTEVDSLIAKRLNGVMRVTRHNLFIRDPFAPPPAKEDDEGPKFPERTSMAETFGARRAAVGRQKWK